MDQLREQGIEPLAITSLLGKIGTSDPVEAKQSLDILKDEIFIFKNRPRASPF